MCQNGAPLSSVSMATAIRHQTEPRPTLARLNEHGRCFSLVVTAMQVSRRSRRRKLYRNYLLSDVQYFSAELNYSSTGFRQTHKLYFQPVS
ncbi:hypothetical protein Baya_13917 [Bagarius yarrelli]|uniref:Uncharacterized protein n=1 Tax=Bagarius yarrelli TaxID=175774 RepID=A0A556V7B5_BAGYA|nr:hypothetical protein Baya_13917 [Bagarius yarrelli]